MCLTVLLVCLNVSLSLSWVGLAGCASLLRERLAVDVCVAVVGVWSCVGLGVRLDAGLGVGLEDGLGVGLCVGLGVGLGV